VLGGGPVPPSEVRRLARDAFVKAVTHDGVRIDTVVHYGRRKKLPAVLETALGLGPPPRFPGVACRRCGRRFGLQWDHIDPVANGGPTSAANTQPLCWGCHQDKTSEDRAAGLLGTTVGDGRGG
jgi:5-methylcytosine-specific restriction endonuclease McrA